jgi:spermidine synthase
MNIVEQANESALNKQRIIDSVQAETLVHPIMLAHRRPKRILLVNAHRALEEVLKHNTVEAVTVIESTSNTMFEQLKDPTGRSRCMDDPRVTVRFDDPVIWIREQQLHKSSIYDVILLDLS